MTLSDVTQRKRELRRRLRAERDAEEPSLRSQADVLIAAGVFASSEFADCETLLGYVSFGSEVDTRRILLQALALGKEVALPRCAGPRQLAWHRIESLEGLVRHRHGMLEPDPARCPELRHPDSAHGALALVPALAFDRSGFRLGYGGGYYDSFLSSFSGMSAGLARECEMVEDLGERGVLEPHDHPVRLVITDEALYRA